MLTIEEAMIKLQDKPLEVILADCKTLIDELNESKVMSNHMFKASRAAMIMMAFSKDPDHLEVMMKDFMVSAISLGIWLGQKTSIDTENLSV